MILEPYESMFPRKKKQITRKWWTKLRNHFMGVV
jgi:hypothetical protein